MRAHGQRGNVLQEMVGWNARSRGCCAVDSSAMACVGGDSVCERGGRCGEGGWGGQEDVERASIGRGCF